LPDENPCNLSGKKLIFAFSTYIKKLTCIREGELF
jgi:hypothetical protein